mgnify:CR=1 FL=1
MADISEIPVTYKLLPLSAGSLPLPVLSGCITTMSSTNARIAGRLPDKDRCREMINGGIFLGLRFKAPLSGKTIFVTAKTIQVRTNTSLSERSIFDIEFLDKPETAEQEIAKIANKTPSFPKTGSFFSNEKSASTRKPLFSPQDPPPEENKKNDLFKGSTRTNPFFNSPGPSASTPAEKKDDPGNGSPKRSAMRVRHCLPFTCSFVCVEEGFPISGNTKGEAIDLSETGMKAALDLPANLDTTRLTNGTILPFIHIGVRFGSQPITILARPMWVRDNPEKTGGSHVGMKFIHMNPASHKQLTNLIETLAVCGQMGRLKM